MLGTDRGCTIAKTEERAITVRQLRELVEQLKRRCVAEGWTSTNPSKNGERLTPETVTLYDLCHYLIKPLTAARKCSYVELVASGPQRRPGDDARPRRPRRGADAERV